MNNKFKDKDINVKLNKFNEKINNIKPDKFNEKIDKIELDDLIIGQGLKDMYDNRSTKDKELFSPMQFLAISLIAIAAIIIAYYWLVYEKPIYKQNAESLRYSLQAEYEKTDITNRLDELTNFKWDTLYSFAPYTPVEEIVKKLGNPWVSYESSISEASNQLIFTYNDEVVCYVNGHPDFYGLYLDVGSYKTNTFVVKAKDKPRFHLTRDESGNYILTYIYPYGQATKEFIP